MNIPDRKSFAGDPFGYAVSGFHKWQMIRTMAGFPVNFDSDATEDDLKNPVLWMTQANALSEAATLLVRAEPEFSSTPIDLRTICDSQFCGTALMLVGYSLEISLKAMLIIKNGIDVYREVENKHRHHRLTELSNFIPDLNDKEIAILKCLTYFVYWAGRYPDPGRGKTKELEDIFELSEKFKITAEDLFSTAGKVMQYAKVITSQS